MHPATITWGGHPLTAYRIFLTAALVVFAELVLVVARANGLPLLRVLAATTLLMAGALAGSRLLYVLTHPTYDRSLMWRRGEAGASVLAGVLVLIAAGPPLAWALGLGVGTYLDVLAIAALPAVAVGRVGCLLHGCCAGKRLPVPLLEAVLVLAAWAALLWLQSREPVPGTLFLAGCGLYCAVRGGLQALRPPEPNLLGMAHSQAIAFAICGVTVSALLVVNI